MHTFLCLLGFLFKLFEAFLQLNPLSLCVLTSLFLPLQLGPAETDIIRGRGEVDNAAGPCRERSYNITGRGEVDSAARPCRERGHITLRGEGK